MAATETASRALLALSTAALALPGVRAHAAMPATSPAATALYGYYEESDERMKVEVYHGDFVAPAGDRLQFSFSLDRDTYSGATPAYSLPSTLINQPRFKQNEDGSPAAELSLVDVVSAASRGVTAGGLTILGGLNTFKDFVDARAAAEAQFIAANPRPASTPPPPTLAGPVNVDFQQMTFASYSGAANVAPLADGSCPGNAALGCYLEDGIAVGIVADSSNPVAHLHRAGAAADRRLSYHADSSGIYLRAVDGSAFNLDALDFVAPISGANPDTAAADVWEILGFDAATNPALDVGDGTNYAERVARATVANGFNGTVALDAAFQNIKALWIHYQGHPQTPTDGKDFEMRLDNVRLSGVAASTAETPAQLAWSQQLEREVAIAQYQAVLDRVIPARDPPTQRLQAHPRESRTQPEFTARYFWDASTLAVTGGQSTEPDFESNFGSFELSREFNNSLTTLSLGYGYTHNTITRSEASHGPDGHADHDHNATNYPELKEESSYHNLSLSLGQALSRNSWLQLSGSYTRQDGFLSNPYKLVYVRGEITAAEYYALWQAGDGDVDWRSVTPLEVVGIELFRERRPDHRRHWSVSTRLNQHLPALGATIHLDYRYYTDDWDISAHTVGVEWYQQLPAGFTVTPFLRYYTQSKAEFFAPYFLAPRADGHYSSDFRLSGYGAASAGLTLTRQVGDALRLQAGIEYYAHRSAFKLDSGASGDYADFDNYLAQATLSVDFSAGGLSELGHAADRVHRVDAPSGVLFAHRLPKAGEFMVGYRYMAMTQAGAMQRGSSPVADDIVIREGCGTSACRSRPSSTTMRMHMLELMVAPTDWLTLMLMPQLFDADMRLRPLAGATGDSTHIGEHSSDGIGDTTLAVLLRVFERPGAHAHVGLAISAPSGDAAATLDGLSGSLPQDFGMQRGSGTWDARPTLTYLGDAVRWFWGAQIGGVIRLENRNDAGYALGDGWQVTGWSGVRLTPWLSATLRAAHGGQDRIRGTHAGSQRIDAPVDDPRNYGGRYTDIGVGLGAVIADGPFAGHRFTAEWLQPVADDRNGIQLERDGVLMASWSYAF